jgi:2-methylcitrate synthase|tara:strand:+ start:96 stop:1217 length:1122 start_codon:yes stop_codon:yes gene_type:complete
MTKKLEGAGLRGQVAGETSLSTVGQIEGLAYRGYKIELLAEKSTFEEVAYLLIYDKLPNLQELDDYKKLLKSHRDLPVELKEVLQKIPATAHPMDVMRTGTSMLGNLEPEGEFSNQLNSINRMIATMPSIVTYWYKYSHEGLDINLVNDEESMAGHFLHILHGKTPSDLHRKVMDVSLILYAEHEFNASTFTARVCASTMSDIHSCVVAAIGSLRGPLHGGANEKAMELIENWRSKDEAKSNVLEMLNKKEKIMGFGHAVYSIRDPRNAVIKEYAKQLSELADDNTLYLVADEVEKVMADEKNMFANADFFHAPAYFYMGIPTKLFTPIFVMSRVSGWTAHCMEQRANNRIIRPSAEYTGVESSDWIDIADRS